MVAAKATPSPTATGGRAVGVLARKIATRAAQIAREGSASVIGVCGLASVSWGAYEVYRPAGFIVGGALAVWLASLLPGGER